MVHKNKCKSYKTISHIRILFALLLFFTKYFPKVFPKLSAIVEFGPIKLNADNLLELFDYRKVCYLRF